MSKRRDSLKAQIVRARVRAMLSEGKPVSAIAKAVGKSYKHVKMIVEQEKSTSDQEQ